MKSFTPRLVLLGAVLTSLSHWAQPVEYAFLEETRVSIWRTAYSIESSTFRYAKGLTDRVADETLNEAIRNLAWADVTDVAYETAANVTQTVRLLSTADVDTNWTTLIELDVYNNSLANQIINITYNIATTQISYDLAAEYEGVEGYESLYDDYLASAEKELAALEAGITAINDTIAEITRLLDAITTDSED